MEELKNKIGETWEDIIKMQQDIMCLLPGTVYFGEIQSIPYSSAKRVELYNETSSFMLDYIEKENIVKLVAVY